MHRVKSKEDGAERCRLNDYAKFVTKEEIYNVNVARGEQSIHGGGVYLVGMGHEALSDMAEGRRELCHLLFRKLFSTVENHRTVYFLIEPRRAAIKILPRHLSLTQQALQFNEGVGDSTLLCFKKFLASSFVFLGIIQFSCS